MKTQKLGIIGLGHVGEHVLAYASQSELFGEIVTIDINEDKAFGEALDQRHATGLFTRNNINIYQGNYSNLKDADIIIICATYVYDDGRILADRQALIGDNASIIRDIMRQITEVTQEAILIFITNPADTVTFMAASEFNYPQERIMSTGCMLDTARFKQILGEHYGVDPKSVSAYMIGEHGYTAVPVLSKTTIAGIPYEDLPNHFPDVEHWDADTIQEKVVQSAYEVLNAKTGVTNAAIGQVAFELAKAILLDEKAIFSVSTAFTEGEYGASAPLCFATPTVVGRNGWEKRFIVPLNDWEEAKMQTSIDSILANIELAKESK